MNENTVFETFNVSYSYIGNSTALESINIKIEKGESVAILGANGSGKSTLLKLLDALYFPTDGKMKAFGTYIDEKRMRDKEFARKFHSKVGLLFQDPDVQLFLPTVWDEVIFAPLQLGMPKEDATEIVSLALNKLGLYHLKDRPPYHLSEGEKKKVTIASILTLDPDVWLMDEPTSSLDPKTQGWVIDFIIDLQERGKTIIVATHDLEIPYVATKRCYVLGENHRVIEEGLSVKILNNTNILLHANLIHKHRHMHKGIIHTHIHKHWE